MQEMEEHDRDTSPSFPSDTTRRATPGLRVAIGLGDPERERTLLPWLTAGGAILIVERCLSADQLATCAETNAIDVIVLADDIHRLTDDALTRISQSRVPLVILTARPDDPRWNAIASNVLPLDANPDAVQQATLAARAGRRPLPTLSPEIGSSHVDTGHFTTELSASELTTFAVVSGHGSPGRTVVALNLATALGAVAPTILVDADVAGPSIAAYLDLDPTRNLFMLAHADPQSTHDWDGAIAAEIQPLGPRSPRGVVLGGIPKPEMRAGVSAHFFERLLIELRQRYRFVIVDVGADLLGSDRQLHRLALGASQQVLFVAAADLVGIWHARVGLGLLARSLHIANNHIALVINRYDRHVHHPRVEIEWTLGHPIAAIIPEDPGHVQRALLAQCPVVLDRRSRAGRSLLDLAERVHGGRIALPPEGTAKRRQNWLGRLRRSHWLFHRGSTVTTGGRNEHDLAATR